MFPENTFSCLPCVPKSYILSFKEKSERIYSIIVHFLSIAPTIKGGKISCITTFRWGILPEVIDVSRQTGLCTRLFSGGT